MSGLSITHKGPPTKWVCNSLFSNAGWLSEGGHPITIKETIDQGVLQD